MLKICRKHISLPYRVHERKCYEEVFVQHDSSPPANMTEREKVLVGSLPPPPVSAPVLADLGVFASISSSNHNGDTASCAILPRVTTAMQPGRPQVLSEHHHLLL